MNCPFCNATDTKVIDSRLMTDGFSVKRRRKCEKCEKRFNTYEKIELSMPMVVKSDGRREEYRRDKILKGIGMACQKRPISTAQIERIIENIERSILELNDKEITSYDIGQFVTDYLRNLDPVAYVRFASVYKQFQDVEEFVKDLKDNEQTHTTQN
jgi:transcriptional repressor NrdR